MKREEVKIFNATQKDIIHYKSELQELIKESLINGVSETKLTNYKLNSIYQSMLNYLQTNNAIINLALCETLAGFIWFFKKDDNRIHINYLAVSTKNRNGGIGKKLIESVEEFARDHELNEIELFVASSNIRAENFYITNGYDIEVKKLVKVIEQIE